MTTTNKKIIAVIAAVLVLAVVTVAALAVAGVFGKKGSDLPVATAEGAVQESQVIRGFSQDSALYLSGNFSGDPRDVIKVKDSSGNEVSLKVQSDHGVKPLGDWIPGMSYTVSLSDSRYTFAGGAVDGLSSFVCTIAKAQVADVQVKEGLIFLAPGEYELDEKDGISTLTVYSDPGENPVFVIDNGTKSRSLKLGDHAYVAHDGDDFVMTVVNAEVEDVYESLDFTQTYTLADEGVSFVLKEEESIASIQNSSFYLAAVEALYGEDLGVIDKLSNQWIETRIDFNMNGMLESFDLNITVAFKGIIKKNGQRDPNSKITIRIGNNLKPTIDVNIQSEGSQKAFDVAVDLDVRTTASVIAEYSASSNPGDEDTLQKTALKLAQIAKDYLTDKAGTSGMDNTKDPYVFGHWQFPIGTLPICIDYQMGLEVKAEFAGEIGVTATNDLSLSFGAVYADGRLQGFHNVDDTFKLGSLSMLGTVGFKVGLVNMIGISAYGTVTVDLNLAFGPYVDLAGKLDVDLDQLLQGKVDVIPAYYIEAGIYINLALEGKVFKWTIARKDILSKKFPLYTLGDKYIPVTADYEGWPTTDGSKVANPFVDETVYMNGSYFYLTGYEVMALDIQSIGTPFQTTLGYDKFNYEVADSKLLTIDGNKVKVAPTSPAEFTTTIKVTNKLNKALTKTVTVVKNPELPTVAEGQETQVFDKSYPTQDVYYPVRLNGSAFQRVYLDGVELGNVIFSDENGLKVPSEALRTLDYGSHIVLVESNKGYLNLNLQVVNSKALPKSLSAQFDKSIGNNVVISVDLQGKKIESFADGNFSYRQSTNSLTVPASFFMDKAVGRYELLLALASGEEIDVVINVQDNRQPVLNSVVYEYIQGNDDLQLDVSLFGNEVTSLVFDNATLSKGTVISKSILATKSAGEYNGTLSVGGKSFDFSVVIGESNLMVVPVKHFSYDKASGTDLFLTVLAPQGKSVSLSGCEDAVLEGNSLRIPAAFLAGLDNGSWEGELSGKGIDNKATISVEITNSSKPILTSAATVVAADRNVTFTFDWQGVELKDVAVEGLEEGQFELAGKVLTVKVADLAYGTTPITVYTPVSTLSLSVVRKGTAVLTKGSVTVDKTNPQEVNFQVDLAHESFVEVKLFEGDKDLGLVPTDYRFNNGKITLANELVYNLKSGNYTVKVVLSESELQGSLRINGQLNTFRAVGSGDGSKGNPFLIYTAEQLADLGNTKKKSEVAGYWFKLMADIDMTGVEMQPIGDKQQPYTGTFDGNGYSIYNLKITKAVDLKIDGEKIGAAIGLFAFNRGSILNLRLVNPVVELADSGAVSAGIVAGFNSGTIQAVTIVNGVLSATSKSWLNIKNAYFDLGAVAGTNEGGVIDTVNVSVEIKGEIKGISLFGLQITGRKSLINVGAVVGYATAGESKNGKLKNVNVSATIDVKADNNNINNNGWYGYTDITFSKSDLKRVRVTID